MTEDQYVQSIVGQRLPTAIPVDSLEPLWIAVKTWANRYLLELKESGSYAKGTAVAGSSDLDVLISLRNDALSGNTPNLATLFDSLNGYLIGGGFQTRLQNVSIGVRYNGISVDLVPAVKHAGNTNDHSIYKRKAKSWTKTNVDTHINLVRNSGRTLDIRALKIWRNLHHLDISSFYLEQVVLKALWGRPLFAPAANFQHVLEFLGGGFVDLVVMDPANTATVISDELSRTERLTIRNAAIASGAQPNWGQVIW